jgi:oligopeptide transport system ATP-binding protein
MSDEPARTAASSARASSRPLVQVERLTKLYPIRRGPFAKPSFVHAVEGASFNIRRGETLGLVGESGCGKSTLGRCILRLTEPTAGRVAFDGQDITKMPDNDLRPLRRRMQIVFQDPYSSLNPHMTVREIVGEGITVFRLARRRTEADTMIADVLTKVGLRPDMMGRYPHELSGGQRQRVGIARALAVKPDFIVCDEPISALDVSVQAQIMNLLEDLQDELSVTLLFISHDLRAVAYMSHRIAVMYLGRIVEIGSVADVREKRYHPYTRALWSAIPGAAGKRQTEPQLIDATQIDAPQEDLETTVTEGPPSVPPAGEGEQAKKPASLVRRLIVGEPPSAPEPPPGCVFHLRCPKAEKGRCDVEAPGLQEIVPGSHHRVACWYPELD